MNSRERVINTLNHKESDIIPYHLDLTDEVHQRLIDYFNDEDFFNKTGSHLAQERNESFEELNDQQFKDIFGVTWNRQQEGDFGVVDTYLLKEPSLNHYTFPHPDEKLIREKCQCLEKQTDKFRMYTIGFSLFERAWTLRGMENVLMDFIVEEDFIDQLLDKIVQYNCKVIDIVKEYDIDCVFLGDDWGMQKGLIMGYKYWKKYIKPRLKIMYDKIKSYGMYVAQHSCGDINEVFDDLVELGLDIYNTFQPEVYDIVEIKEKYGSNLTFYGGISTQKLLPFANVDEVKAETNRIMRILGKHGGYIAAPTHAIPNDVPIENIIAFLKVVQNQN